MRAPATPAAPSAGLDWDGPALRQSDRSAAYASALDRLRELGAVYPCFCTRREIEEEIGEEPSEPAEETR